MLCRCWLLYWQHDSVLAEALQLLRDMPRSMCPGPSFPHYKAPGFNKRAFAALGACTSTRAAHPTQATGITAFSRRQHGVRVSHPALLPSRPQKAARFLCVPRQKQLRFACWSSLRCSAESPLLSRPCHVMCLWISLQIARMCLLVHKACQRLPDWRRSGRLTTIMQRQPCAWD